MKDNLPCAVVRDLLPIYVEGLTEPETNAAMEAHLKTCPACTARLAAMRRRSLRRRRRPPKRWTT